MQAYGAPPNVYMSPPPPASLPRDSRPLFVNDRQNGSRRSRAAESGGEGRSEHLTHQLAAMNLGSASQGRQLQQLSSSFQWRLDAPEFVPQSVRRQQEPDEAYQQSEQQKDQLQCFLWELVNWLSHLYMEPGNFEIISHQISSQMNCAVRCERDLTAVMDKFFEISMSYPHFSYHAARLCIHFNARFFAGREGTSGMFRRALLRRCQANVDARFTMLKDPALLSQSHNFVLFMAELYVQFLDDDKPLEALQNGLLLLMDELLKQPSDLSIKCCISALKCCGAYLQHYAPSELESLFNRLQKVVLTDELPQCVVSALESLIKARSQWEKNSLQILSPDEACDWAKSVAETSANIVLDQSDSAIYYGPDGVPLTNEESAFLAEADQQSGDEELIVNGVLSEDDIIAEAYEEFLEMQATKNKNGLVVPARQTTRKHCIFAARVTFPTKAFSRFSGTDRVCKFVLMQGEYPFVMVKKANNHIAIDRDGAGSKDLAAESFATL
uniref:MIF4G domain-containing protein n=1 Tax=Trichuris muris TaxID=70415 RepID=A0A5S6QKS3_TRIMR